MYGEHLAGVAGQMPLQLSLPGGLPVGTTLVTGPNGELQLASNVHLHGGVSLGPAMAPLLMGGGSMGMDLQGLGGMQHTVVLDAAGALSSMHALLPHHTYTVLCCIMFAQIRIVLEI